MKGGAIPDSDHVSRHVRKDYVLRDGSISGQAFRRRPVEEYMSVNWVEYFRLAEHIVAIQEIRMALVAKGFHMRNDSKFAVMNVGQMMGYVKKEANCDLHVMHEPTRYDPSHAGVFNMPIDDTMIGNLIARLISKEAIYPAHG